MKKLDADQDYNRSKFLIMAMIVQIVLVLVVMIIYWAYLRL